jgi:hypothetical protein
MSGADMSGADAGVADGGGRQNRRQRTTAADGYGQRRMATDDSGPKEAVHWWRAAVAWMAANGSGGIKMNVERLLRIPFLPRICSGHPFFLPVDLSVAPAKTNH